MVFLICVIALFAISCCGEFNTSLNNAGTNENLVFGTSNITNGGEKLIFSTNTVTDKDSVEWIIGRWDCKKVEQRGPSVLLLDKMARLCVFPYFDYRTPPYKEGTVIAAEFQVTNKNGHLVVAAGYLPVRLFSTKIMTGLGMVWTFLYSKENINGKQWLKLELETKDKVSYVLMFEKNSPDPGQPLDAEQLFFYAPALRKEYSKEYGK